MRPPLDRRRLGFVLLVALLASLAGAKAVLFDTLDPDCFWHLKVAEAIKAQGIGPIVDDLSFSSQRTPWTPYSWLAELGMKGLWDAGGFRLAVAVQALLQAGFVVGIALSGIELGKTAGADEQRWPIVLASALAGYWSLPYLSFRPVTMVLVLLAWTAWLLLRDRRLRQRSAGVWLVAPVTLLATNMHLFAFFIPVWVMCLLVGDTIDLALRRSRGVEISPGPLPQSTLCPVRYAWLFLATSASFFATPMLRGMVRSILFYTHHDVMVAGPVIAEMHSILAGSYLNIALLLVIFVGVFRSRKRMGTGEIVWLVASTLLLLKLGRFAPIFAMIACPVFAATLPALSDRVMGKPLVLLALTGLLLLLIGRVGWEFPSRTATVTQWLNRHGPEAPGYPAESADFVLANVSPEYGRIINEFTWGGYLEWRLHPRFRTLLDGRTQVFPAELWQMSYLGTEADHQRLVERANADVAIIPIGKSLFRSALLARGWQSVHRDDRAEVLVPPKPTAIAPSK